MSGKIISIDPGEKFTGITFEGRSFTVHASNYDGWDAYVKHIIRIVDLVFYHYWFEPVPQKNVLIIEDFILYKHKADVQSFQKMKTSELIGALNGLASKELIIVKQTASQAKVWTNKRLVDRGFLEHKSNRYHKTIHLSDMPLDRHALDSLRHHIYYLNKNEFEGCITPDKYYRYLGYMWDSEENLWR